MRATCTVADCDDLVKGQGLCSKHYHRKRRHGTTDLPPRAKDYPCVAEGCELMAVFSTGYCRVHHFRVLRSGRTEPPTLEERFLANFDMTATGCWLWQGSITESGYGNLGFSGGRVVAHRFSWEMFRGPIPDGLVIDHLCRNRACVRPDHLEPVTHAENIARGVGQGAINRRKTHCKRGHEFTPENTYIQKQGGRMCRICIRGRLWLKGEVA